MPLKLKTTCWQTIVTPKVKVYSGAVYSALKIPVSKTDLSLQKNDKYMKNVRVTNLLTNNNDNVNILIHYLRKNDLNEAAKYLVNDLEVAVIKFCPALNRLKERLKVLKSHAVMVSGSGPSVFGLMDNEKSAQKAKAVLKRYRQVVVAKTF